MVTGPAMASFRQSLATSAFDLPSSIFEKAEKREREDYARILTQNQNASNAENAYVLHQELGETMLRDCTIERENPRLDKVIAKIGELDERAKRVRVTDTSARVNQGAQFVRHLENMLLLARVIAQGARNRDESRGAHYKPEFPKRDDQRFMRTTLPSTRRSARWNTFEPSTTCAQAKRCTSPRDRRESREAARTKVRRGRRRERGAKSEKS